MKAWWFRLYCYSTGTSRYSFSSPRAPGDIPGGAGVSWETAYGNPVMDHGALAGPVSAMAEIHMHCAGPPGASTRPL